MSGMQCNRPGCDCAENRIDGYCSCYCRDLHELEIENDKLQRQRDQALRLLRLIFETVDETNIDSTQFWQPIEAFLTEYEGAK